MRLRFRWVALCSLVLLGCGEDPVEPDLPDPAAELTALTLVGGKGLNPAFDPAIERYSVVSDTAGEVLVVTVMAEPGVSVTVDGVPVAVGHPHGVAPEPGSAVTVAARSPSGEEVAYEIHYLAEDFPEFSVSSTRDEPGTEVTYVTVGTWLAILDDHGVPVFHRREADRVSDFKLHPSGERSYAVRTGELNEHGARQHEIVVLDESFVEVDRVTTVGLNHTDNHDFLIRPNGNYVLLAYHGEIRDMSAFGGTPDQLVEESVVQEITRDREVVFEWSSWDEVPFGDALRDWEDYAHVNSVFIDDNQDFILSLRGVSQVVKVSRSTGSVVWKLGGKSNEFAFVDDPFAHICGQHTASFVAEGRLLLFDNGQLCWPESPDRGELTRAVEYEIDEGSKTARLVWSYTRPNTYTLSAGSTQRLPDGNTLVGWGRGPDVMATEVDPLGQTVWELRGSIDGASVRTYRATRATR